MLCSDVQSKRMDIRRWLAWSLVLLEAVVNCDFAPSATPDTPSWVTLPENTTVGTEIFILKGVDKDPGESLQFSTSTTETIELVTVNTTVFNVTLNQWTCSVFLKTELDVDNSPSSRLLVFSLTDGKTSTPVRVRLFIMDVNDNPPTFVGLPYRTSIREDLNIGSMIFIVTARDPDSGDGGEISYSMKSVIADGNQTFIISPDGNITLNKPLDYERQYFYHYNVSAKDRGNPPCPGDTCQCKGRPDICNPGPVDFFITIIDIQDTPPVFERLPYMGSVQENSTVGSPILQVIATDGDRGVSEPNIVIFSFSGGDNSPFQINETDGMITVGTVLDADSDEKGGLYIFTVTATEILQNGSLTTSNPNNQSSTQVSITVTDVNDNPPEFKENIYTAVVLENTPSGVPITTSSPIEVHDRDQGSNSRFWVYLEKDGTSYHDFDTIPEQNMLIQGRSTVTIRVINSTVLDYETTKNITFKVVARENNTDPNIRSSSEATVILTIEDVNDNNPYFPSQPNKFNVSEDAPVSLVIANITAEDVDSGDFGQIIFSLEDSDEEFNISDEGQLRVEKPLDREQRSVYSLVVVATDSPNSNANQRRRSTLRIQISVTDVNDNAPIWTQFIPSLSILESTEVGTNITEVRAVDLDYGNNAQIEYFITQGTNGSDLFKVTPTKEAAKITVGTSLLDHVGLHLVQVMARDKGIPPLSSLLNLSIFVIDENQNKPVFIQPNQTAYDEMNGIVPVIMVEEEQPEGTVLYTLLATDNDLGQNGIVEYYLNPSTNRDYEYFKVARVNGTLHSARRLDRESKELYEIQVRAEDNGKPVPLSTVLTMRIKLIDINDNVPSYKGIIMPQIMHVIEENSNAHIGQIQPAFDSDSYPYNQSCYYLYGNGVSGFFLDKHSGNFNVTEKVDREMTSELNAVIKASENCNLTYDYYISTSTMSNISAVSVPSILKRAPESYNSSDVSLLWVEVFVDDINDNKPTFLYHEFSTSALFDVDIGTEVLSIATSITDKDTPENSRNIFKLLSTTPYLEIGEHLDTSKTPFLVSGNGSITTNIRFQSDLLGYFLLRVQVYDNDGLNDSASVKVYLISNLQRIKLVFNKLPNQVEELKNNFVKQLSDILKVDLVIDKVQSHTNSDGTRDPTRTDAYMHGRYRDTGKVVPASDLWKMLDFSLDARALLYSNGVIEALPLTVEKVDDETEELKRIFAILVSVLAVIVIVLLLVLIHLVRLYRRRLRAATVAYSPSKEKEFFEHPGTNKYFAAKNPLFGKDIKHVAPDDDKTSHNSLDVNEVDQPYSTPNPEPLDMNEEQEMVLQITDSNDVIPMKDVNHSTHLDQVLQAYCNEAYENDDDDDTFGGYGKSRGVNLQPSSIYNVLDNDGEDFQEGVTRFSDENMYSQLDMPYANSRTHMEHTDI